ncbi:MAG: enoyl-CoA hydratase-related protein, partial [Thermodesulfobacteriota bacterium]
MNSISFELDKNGIAVLRFNNPESSVNKLSQNDVSWLLEFLDNIDRQLDMIENEDEIRAVVLYSGKESSFINGGEIREYLNFTLADEARVYSLKAQEVTEKIESSRAPFIAAIGGACLGMGLEIVLACTYRIAAGNSQTYFGMNEVETGLIPCAGGTQRLPRLIGTREALDLILSGDTFNFDYAKNLGLIDEVVPEEILLEISMERALQISNKEFKPRRPHFRGIKYTIVNENPIARKKLFNDARKQVKKDRQPAITSPIMAIEALEVGMSSFNRGLHVESVYFGELVVSTTSRSLIRTQMALEKVKDETGFSKTGIKTIRGIEKVAVVGTSPMGIKIASLAADNGVRVRLKGDDDVEAGSGLKECYSFF